MKTDLSRVLDRKWRRETGLQWSTAAGLSVGFLSSGETRACFSEVEKVLVERDVSKIKSRSVRVWGGEMVPN